MNEAALQDCLESLELKLSGLLFDLAGKICLIKGIIKFF